MKNKNDREKGFTLFELLIVILLVAVVGGISTVILVSALRGSDRTNSINKVRASGNYAITQMTKMIKYAQSFEGISTDGTDYTESCLPPVAAISSSPVIAKSESPVFLFDIPKIFSRFNNFRKEAGLFFASLLPRFGESQVPKGEVAGVNTTTFDVQSSDGYMRASLSDTGCLIINSTSIQLGQTTSYAYRGFLSFDTSVIPDVANITSATLKLYYRSDLSDTDFNIVARYKDWGLNVDCSDWDTNPTSIIAGTYTTSSWVTENNNINLSDTSVINKLGITYISLASDREESNTPPTQNEYISTYAYEQGGFFAKLEVTYDTPDPTPTPTLVPTSTPTPTPGPTSTPPPPTPTPTPTKYHFVKITGFDGGQTTFHCDTSGIASNSAALIDTNSVSVSSCSITCVQDSIVSPPTINIDFTLFSNSGSTFYEKQASIPFHASVTMRNY